MATKKFDAEELTEALWYSSDIVEIIEDEITDNGRWCIYHSVIFKDLETGKYYSAGYSKGATEYQEGEWFGKGEIECPEVHQVRVIKEVWEEV